MAVKNQHKYFLGAIYYPDSILQISYNKDAKESPTFVMYFGVAEKESFFPNGKEKEISRSVYDLERSESRSEKPSN